jgi:hypothetical protein
MSFTEDELQAFNSILEQRFSIQRQEMEQAINRRLESFQQKIDQRFVTLQQELSTSLEQWLASRREQSGVAIEEKLEKQRKQIVQLVSQEAEQKSHQVEATVDRMLAAQLLGIEQLLGQHSAKRQLEVDGTNPHQQLETIEVQTELSWEDLVAVMGKALDERLIALSDSLQHSVKNLEQYLAVRLHSLRDELTRLQGPRPTYNNNVLSNGTSVQEVLTGIEHLEQVMESIQVTMTANHALLSNRLYHHQQLPLERAHPNPSGQTHVAPANGVSSLLAQAKERLASGLEPEIPPQQNEAEEPTGH